MNLTSDLKKLYDSTDVFYPDNLLNSTNTGAIEVDIVNEIDEEFTEYTPIQRRTKNELMFVRTYARLFRAEFILNKIFGDLNSILIPEDPELSIGDDNINTIVNNLENTLKNKAFLVPKIAKKYYIHTRFLKTLNQGLKIKNIIPFDIDNTNPDVKNYFKNGSFNYMNHTDYRLSKNYLAYLFKKHKYQFKIILYGHENKQNPDYHILHDKIIEVLKNSPYAPEFMAISFYYLLRDAKHDLKPKELKESAFPYTRQQLSTTTTPNREVQDSDRNIQIDVNNEDNTEIKNKVSKYNQKYYLSSYQGQYNINMIYAPIKRIQELNKKLYETDSNEVLKSIPKGKPNETYLSYYTDKFYPDHINYFLRPLLKKGHIFDSEYRKAYAKHYKMTPRDIWIYSLTKHEKIILESPLETVFATRKRKTPVLLFKNNRTYYLEKYRDRDLEGGEIIDSKYYQRVKPEITPFVLRLRQAIKEHNGPLTKLNFKVTKDEEYQQFLLHMTDDVVRMLGLTNEYTLIKTGIIKNENFTRNATVEYLLSQVSMFSRENVVEYQSNGSDIQQLFAHEVPMINIVLNFRKVDRINTYTQHGWFKYINKSPFNLEKYQIFNKPTQQKTCFVHCLLNSGFTEEELYNSCLNLDVDRFNNKTMTTFAKENNVTFKIKKYKDKKVESTTLNESTNDTRRVINLGVVDEHIFINEYTQYSLCYVKNHKEIGDDPKYYRVKKYHPKKGCEYGAPVITSMSLIVHLLKQGCLKKMTLSEGVKCKYTPLKPEIKATEKVKSRPTKFIEKKENTRKLFFADIEANTEGDIHKAYSISYTNGGGGIKFDMSKYCLTNFMKFIPHNSQVYFHNLAYDFKFFISLNRLSVGNIIKIGNKIFKADVFYPETLKGDRKYKKIEFRDTYPLMSFRLAKLKDIYLSKDEAQKCIKDIYPYDYFTAERIEWIRKNKNTYVDTKDMLAYIKPNDRKEFIKINGNKINPAELIERYNNQDVYILKTAFINYSKQIKDAVDIELPSFLSTASFANYYLLREGCYEDVHELSGMAREFIQKCFHGGRVLTRKNKKWLIKKKIVDFDGVSLYPSAMARIKGLVKGAPKKIIDKSMEFLNTTDYYFVKVQITKVNKKLSNPYICHKSKYNTTYSNDTGIVYLGKVGLEDLIKFQKIEFEILEGYYFDEGVNDTITKVIKQLFNLRLEVKKKYSTDDPRYVQQEVYKVIMNSAYGKNAEKPHDTSIEVHRGYRSQMLLNQAHNIVSIDSHIGNNSKYDSLIVKKTKETNNHYNRVHVACIITDMSRRIMNEVMSCAEDNDIPVFYQDTDSMHIEAEKIEKLAECFEKEYGRELIGKQLGQFHSDFSLGSCKDIVATETIILGKKCYYDRLLGDGEVEGVHIRMKGVSHDSIEYKALEDKISIRDIYYKLLRNESITFDLTCGGEKLCLNMRNNFTISNRKEFSRVLSFEGDYEIYN